MFDGDVSDAAKVNKYTTSVLCTCVPVRFTACNYSGSDTTNGQSVDQRITQRTRLRHLKKAIECTIPSRPQTKTDHNSNRNC